MVERARTQGRRKSNFPASELVPSGATFDFVSGGVNFKITFENLLLALGATGTLEQAGDPLATPVLQVSGSVNSIRNLEDGPGVKTSISPQNGITVEHNFLQGSGGVPILDDPTAAQPTIQNLIPGVGISIADINGGIQISSTSAPVSTRTVVISQISDFPDAVGGVIPGEDNIDYLVVNDLAMGTTKFESGDGSVFRASDSAVITLTYTGTESFYNSTDKSNQIRDITIDTPNGSILNLDGSGAPVQFQMIGCASNDCDKLGTVTAMLQTRIDGTQFQGITTDGLSFFGACGLLLFDTILADVDAGALLDLGTATFNGISIISPFADLAAGANMLKGAPDSANLNSGALGSVVNGRRIGTGAMLDGISENDNQWFMAGNDTIPDTRADALLTFGAQNVTINSVNTPVKLNAAGDPWVVERQSQTVGESNGRITYTGLRDVVLPVSISVSCSAFSGSNKIYSFYVYKNGAQITTSRQEVRLSSGDTKNVTILWQDSVQTGDFLEVFVENNTDGIDIAVQNAVIQAN